MRYLRDWFNFPVTVQAYRLLPLAFFRQCHNPEREEERQADE